MTERCGLAVALSTILGNPLRSCTVRDGPAAMPPESVRMSQREAAAELAAIKKAIATSDWAALDAYGGLNPAIQRACGLDAACAGGRRSRAAITAGRTWRSTRVPEWTPGRRAGEAA